MNKDIKFISADEAVKVVKNGDHIHFSSVASAPQVLIQALCRRADAGEIKNDMRNSWSSYTILKEQCSNCYSRKCWFYLKTIWS